tara:strand:- start:301 stop:564 length:264 start_codon:yes stop_codon:yes gene_type:complete
MKFWGFKIRTLRIFLLFFFILIGCDDSRFECGTIERKYEKNGEYFFALVLINSGGDDSGGGRVYGDVSVDKTVYLLKEIGDEHCVEE